MRVSIWCFTKEKFGDMSANTFSNESWETLLYSAREKESRAK